MPEYLELIHEEEEDSLAFLSRDSRIALFKLIKDEPFLDEFKAGLAGQDNKHLMAIVYTHSLQMEFTDSARSAAMQKEFSQKLESITDFLVENMVLEPTN